MTDVVAVDGGVTAPDGFLAGAASAGLRSTPADDLALLVVADGAGSAAATFTTNRFRAAPVLASRSRRDGGDPDVVAATPVARDLSERRETDVAAVRCDTDTVDPSATDDCDAPATLRAGPENGKRVVPDRNPIRPPPLADDRVQRILLGREVDSRHAEDAELGDRLVPAIQARLLGRVVEEPLEHVEAAGQAEVVR